MAKTFSMIAVLAVAAAIGVVSGIANASVSASFSSLGGSYSLYSLPPGETLFTDFTSDPVGTYGGGYIYAPPAAPNPRRGASERGPAQKMSTLTEWRCNCGIAPPAFLQGYA